MNRDMVMKAVWVADSHTSASISASEESWGIVVHMATAKAARAFMWTKDEPGVLKECGPGLSVDVDDNLASWLAQEAEKLGEESGHVVAFLNWEGRGYDYNWKDDLTMCLGIVKKHRTGPIKWGFHDVGLAVVAPAKQDKWVEVRYGNATTTPIEEGGIPRSFFDEAVKDATNDLIDWYETVAEIEKGFSCQKEMTVGKLIQRLAEFPSDLEVKIGADEAHRVLNNFVSLNSVGKVVEQAGKVIITRLIAQVTVS